MRPQLESGVVSNPEFPEGGARRSPDFDGADRIVIGVPDKPVPAISVASIHARWRKKAREFSAHPTRLGGGDQYAPTPFLSESRLSFINEIADFL